MKTLELKSTIQFPDQTEIEIEADNNIKYVDHTDRIISAYNKGFEEGYIKCYEYILNKLTNNE